MSQSFETQGTLESNARVAELLKKDFPVFEQRPELVYLDSSATAQKPWRVLDAERNFYSHSCANVHRAIHAIGEEATSRYEAARGRIAAFIGAKREEVIFTRGTTESINLVAHSFGETLRAGDEIILSEMEHHANLVPWQMLAARRGVVLRFIPLTDGGELNMTAYEGLLNSRTRLVSVTMVSNVLGTINPVEKIISLARNAGARILLDAAQAVPSQTIRATSLDADFLAFSGHKMYGPFGIGVLYGKEALLDALPPFMGGGDMIAEVTLEGFSVNELPYKFEAGTPPISQAVGLAAAADWLESVNIDALGAYESELAQRFLLAVKDLPGVHPLGEASRRSGIVALTLDAVHAHDLAAFLDKNHIAVRAGHHCAHPLARRYGIVSSARFSFGAYNLPQEADRAASLVAKAREVL